jgi:hypothetical protein
MRQRGRRSAEALAINNVDGTPSRLATPIGLNVKERALFEQLVKTTDPRHFRATDTSMLVAFVQAVLLSRQLGRDPSKTREWERATRTMASLATRLRLTPASRTRPETIARQRPLDGVAPWPRAEQTPDEDDEWPPPRPPEDKGIQ